MTKLISVYEGLFQKEVRMRIDLHMHSPASISNGDSIIWESSFNTATQLYQAQVKMAAITDHNVFDKQLYIDIKEKTAGTGLIFLPGVEINVVRLNGQIGHLLVIFEHNLTDKQLSYIANTIKIEIPRYGVSIKKINEMFSEFKTIRIAHVGKCEYFDFNDLQELLYDSIEVTNLNHPNYLSVVRKGLISSVVAFSDTHMWNKYPQQRSYITDIDLENNDFNELKQKLKNNVNYMKEY